MTDDEPVVALVDIVASSFAAVSSESGLPLLQSWNCDQSGDGAAPVPGRQARPASEAWLEEIDATSRALRVVAVYRLLLGRRSDRPAGPAPVGPLGDK